MTANPAVLTDRFLATFHARCKMIFGKAIPFTLLTIAISNELPTIFTTRSPILNEPKDDAFSVASNGKHSNSHYSPSNNDTGLYIQTFIKGIEIPRDDILRWEARRIQVVKKRLENGLLSLLKQEVKHFLFNPKVSIDDIAAEREALVQTKLRMSHDGRKRLVARETNISGAVSLLILKTLTGFSSSSIHMKSNKGTAEGFKKWFESKVSDEKVMLQACPDHYALGTAFGLGQEVVETTGGSVLPSHFAINYLAKSDLPIVEDKDFPHQFNGPAYRNGTETVIGGTNHLMRSIPNNGGFEIIPKVFFPSGVPTYLLEQHRWHLATEWGNWITAYVNDEVGSEKRSAGV